MRVPLLAVLICALPWTPAALGESSDTPASLRLSGVDRSGHESAGARLLPTGGVLFALEGEADAENARAALAGLRDEWGLGAIEELGASAFRVDIETRDERSAWDACEAIRALEGVVFAEPDMAFVLDPRPPQLRPVPSAPLRIVGTDFPQGVDGPSSGRTLASWERDKRVGDFEVVFDGHFEEGFAQWFGLRALGAPRAIPHGTDERAHGGRFAMYMTGGDLDGVKAPGPYVANAGSVLVGPSFSMAGYGEGYLEAWFWPALDPFFSVERPGDYGRLMLLDATTRDVLAEVPLVAEAGSSPTWRRVLLDLPPIAGIVPVAVAVEFSSDGAGSAEGLYVDDLRVLALRGADANESVGPIAKLPYERPARASLERARQVPDTEADAPVKVALIDADLRGHGAACAALIEEVAPGVKVESLSGVSSFADLAQMIGEAMISEAQVIVLPFGWSDVPSELVERALARAADAGVLVLASVGDGPGGLRFPAMLSAGGAVIAVGAASFDGHRKSRWSEDGLYWWETAESADSATTLWAPGTWLRTSAERDDLVRRRRWFEGSGAATCYAAGGAALVLQRDEALSGVDARGILLETAREGAIDPEAAVLEALERRDETEAASKVKCGRSMDPGLPLPGQEFR